MSNPHSEALVPTADEFLTALEDAYHTVKRMRRSIRMDDHLDTGLGLDSLDGMELLLALEQIYGITLIGTPEVIRARTVAELHALVAALSSARTT
jgi:acyl carrier protein